MYIKKCTYMQVYTKLFFTYSTNDLNILLSCVSVLTNIFGCFIYPERRDAVVRKRAK
jgi:hypothetical protein